MMLDATSRTRDIRGAGIFERRIGSGPAKLSPVPPAVHPPGGGAAEERRTLEGASVRTPSAARSVLQSAVERPEGFNAPTAAMGKVRSRCRV